MTQQNQQQPIPSPAGAHRRGKRILAGLFLVSLAAGGGWYWMQSSKAEAAASEAKKPKPQPVYELGASDVAAIEARELRVVLPLSGTLTPQAQATVKAKVAAVVDAMLVAEGMPVRKGQVVARLDTGDLRARLMTQQAAQDEARAKLALARKTHDTNRALLNQKYISQTAFDAAENSVELAQAALKSADSQLDMARRALDDATIRAPFDGIVSKRFVQVGEKVSPDTPVFALVDLKELVFEAQVPAGEIPRVHAGQEVAFGVDGFGGRSFRGSVARINPTAEQGSRAMTVYVAVDNKDGALRGGMFAKGGLVLEKSAPAPLLPLNALRQADNAAVAYKVQQGRLVAQPLKLGLRNDDDGMVEVVEGLREGDHVLVARIDALKPGSAVKLPARAANASARLETAGGVPGKS
ncbi:efflux RND transporter periplasmic adaptor subunit [Noviherbaspirillum galbum]|uniref:Efflux RND transporter periplasmic adaptor subunit n=1 Tax=Noviherbaspirillum galbum TaxID=2709383 RepID=A0A6B3SMM4_9BURK|nr:efflux RND transporter periplasmic adaptor subunit [Noviherbaspirillum galbum]NEX61708.1 efflux RND transporter periplasmic adaptor subunit [Noviherbaspirillum galbum]